MESESMPGGKRDNPNYAQISGHIPKSKKKAFDMGCVEDEITFSEGIEEAVDLWLEWRKSRPQQDKKD